MNSVRLVLGRNPEPPPAHRSPETSRPGKRAGKRDRVGHLIHTFHIQRVRYKSTSPPPPLGFPTRPTPPPSQNSPIAYLCTSGGTLAPARPPDRDASPPAESAAPSPAQSFGGRAARRPRSKFSVRVVHPAASSGSAPPRRPRDSTPSHLQVTREPPPPPPPIALDRIRSVTLCCCDCVYILI